MDFERYRDSLDREKVFNMLKDRWHIPAVLAVVFMGFMLRYMPANGMEYLQAVDPYMIFRMSQHIALEGNLPQLDFSRFFPYATPTYVMNQGDYVIPALLWNAGFGLFFSNYLEWAQFYPAMLGGLSVGVMYFLGKELFDRNTGVSAAFFLAVTPGVLRRTSAGFFEKEPLGTFFMLVSLLFFTRAWKLEDWKYGLFSGLALGLFSVSWGGARMLWLLYPLVTGIVVFLNEDIRSLVASYTPTVLVGGFFATIINSSRFTLTGNYFFLALGVLAFLWSRYLVEKFELVDGSKLDYYGPAMAVFGAVMALLSPLYSDWVANKVIGIFSTALQSGSGVIGGTVAENAPPGATSLVQSMGTVIAQGGFLEVLSMAVSPWLFMIFGVSFMATSIILMLGRKLQLMPEEIAGEKRTAYTQMVFVAWLVFVSALVQNVVFVGALAAFVIGTSLLTLIYFLEGDSAFTIGSLFVGGATAAALIYVLRFSPGLGSSVSMLVLLPAVMASISSLTLHFFGSFEESKIRFRWYIVLPLLWVVSNVYGGMTRSRLVFLTTFSVALAAGYGLSVTVEKLRTLDFSELEFTHPDNLRNAATVFILILVVGLGGASGYLMSQGLGGSPSPSPQVWEPSVDFMQQAPEGSVVLSWWDYGYYFQTLGRTGSVADGGNFGYYTSEEKVNFPLSGYLNSTHSQEDIDFIEKHSADYIWLDRSMIGKFSAVSQIANRDNSQFTGIRQMSTPGSLRDSLSSDGNDTLVNFRGRLGRNVVDIYTPVESTNTSMDISGAPTVRFSNGQTAQIGCVLTEDGRQEYNVSRGLGFCAAEDSVYSLERSTVQGRPRLLLVPETISESTFVQLYIQDGQGVPYAEKVPEASNGYIKMWEIDLDQE